MKNKMNLKRNSPLLHVIILFILLNSISYYTLSLYEKQRMQEYRLDVFRVFLNFQSQVEIIVNDNSNLIVGYLTYLETNSDATEELSNRYLERLLSKQSTLIRNIGIIEDTTILWNYPSNGNSSAIGIDLSKIPSQRDDVLKVKKTLGSIFVGPVDLVQGGQGFITRVPIVRDNEYWGQISIVMDGNKFLNRLDNLSKSLDLEVAMFSKALSESTIFFGRSSILEDNPLTVDFEVFNSNWKIAFLPADGWDNEFFDIRYIRAILFIIIFIICYLAYTYLSTRKNLRKQAMTDYLTGLYNRNFLDKYFKDVESEVKNSKLYDKLLFVNLDIDKFKDINDNYGHKIGDEVLRSFSRNLQDIPVSNKTILRLGGDEFLAIIKLPIGADVSAIETIIKDRINYVFRLNRITLPIVSSVGFALFPDDSEDIDELISKSDLLMYEDKRRRRN